MSGLTLKVGSIVTTTEVSLHKNNNQGVVMDLKSDLVPDDGPIAVFFDSEVEGFLSLPRNFDEHKEPPTPEDYKESKRIFCFEAEELEVIEEFSLKTKARQLYPQGYWLIRSWKFPLIPNSHECQFYDCESDILATEKTIINIWGVVYEVYTCTKCHKEKNGVYGNMLGFKKPLPGVPQDEENKLTS